jgi:hypothetical protein
MTDMIVSQALGFVLGLATSFFSWWVLFHLVVPKIAFSTFISKVPYDADGSRWVFRIKYANHGRRALVDGYAVVLLSIKGLRRKNSWTTFRVPLAHNGEDALPFAVVRPKKNRVNLLHAEACEDFRKSHYLPEATRKLAADGALTIEQLLALGDEAYVQMQIVGSDSWSGARKVFESRRYTSQDIRAARFDRLEPNRDDIAEEAHAKRQTPPTPVAASTS